METISLVIPCFNEEKNISLFYEECKKAFTNFRYSIELVFVNDGSRDNTFSELKKLTENNDFSNVKVVNFSRNFGKEAAMYAGLEHSTGDYVAIIDADLQQKPELIKDMIQEIENDDTIDCVCCFQEQRIEGKLISFFKKSFYKVISKITNMDFVNGASDFRLLKRNVVEAILSINEKNRFSKGIFSWVGFKTKYIPYIPEDRKYGTSSFNFRTSKVCNIRHIVFFCCTTTFFNIFRNNIVNTICYIFNSGYYTKIILYYRCTWICNNCSMYSSNRRTNFICFRNYRSLYCKNLC